MPVQTPLELGLECLKAQKIDEAIEHLEKATVRFPQDHRAFNYLGVAYAQKGLFDRAVAALQAAVRLRADSPSIHYNLGLAYQADGFPDRARDEFEQALKLDASYHKAEEALKALAAQRRPDELSAQACARHTDEPAVAVCSFCHLPVCAKCKTLVDGEVFCSVCAPKRG